MEPKTLDHVAFWVSDRAPIVDFLTKHVGMHVIDDQDAFTLVGSNARRGKLTFFGAEGPRERGAFKYVAVRVADADAARAALPEGSGDEVELGEGVRCHAAPEHLAVERQRLTRGAGEVQVGRRGGHARGS